MFGAWHSTGEGGGLGAKFARCLVSEIVGIDVPVEEVVVDRRTGEVEVQTSGRRTSSRIDPLGILNKVRIYQTKDDNPGDWTPRKDEAATKGANKEPVLYIGKRGKPGRASLINHGNITPSVQPLGVTCDYLEHSFVLSFAALRRLRFGGGDKDVAGRSLVAALGLVALTEQDARGYALRSRCDLVCEGRAPLELVHSDGKKEPISMDPEQARGLYDGAIKNARKAGFTFSAKPLRLTPQDKIVEIVRGSQELALAGAGGEENEAADNDSVSGN